MASLSRGCVRTDLQDKLERVSVDQNHVSMPLHPGSKAEQCPRFQTKHVQDKEKCYTLPIFLGKGESKSQEMKEN